MGGVEGQAGKGEAAHQVTKNGGNLVPPQVVHHRELAAHDDGRREQEHVHDGVLETHEEEQHDGHPHSQYLATDAGGNHGANHAHGDHPVAQHAANENGGPAGSTELRVAKRARFTNTGDLRANGTGIGIETVGEDKRHHEGDGQCAAQVAKEYPTPVAQYGCRGHSGAFIKQCKGREHEHAGQQVEAHQVKHAKADREQDGADQEHAGLDRYGNGKRGSQRQNGARHKGPNQCVPR